MAGPITHVVLSRKVFDEYFKDKDEKKFYIGTSFPDIRHLGVIDRNKTHISNLSLQEIKNEDSFMAGFKFHSFVDEVREKYFISKNIYSYIPRAKISIETLKYYEDCHLYSKINDWEKIISYFDEVITEETEFGIVREDLEKWHHSLQKYFKNTDQENLTEFLKNIGKPVEIGQEMQLELAKIKSNTEVKKIIDDFFEEFTVLVEKE